MRYIDELGEESLVLLPGSVFTIVNINGKETRTRITPQNIKRFAKDAHAANEWILCSIYYEQAQEPTKVTCGQIVRNLRCNMELPNLADCENEITYAIQYLAEYRYNLELTTLCNHLDSKFYTTFALTLCVSMDNDCLNLGNIDITLSDILSVGWSEEEASDIVTKLELRKSLLPDKGV